MTGSLSREEGENAGSYSILKNTLNNTNYEITYTGNNLIITPKSVTITAHNKTKVYGEQDPDLTYSAEGLVNSDQLTGGLVRSGGEDFGNYQILGDSDMTSENNPNYNIIFTGGIFTITKKILTISADDITIIYGDNVPELTYTVTGLCYEDTVTVNIESNAETTVGQYSITISSDEPSGNYVYEYHNGTLTVSPKTINVNANNKTKVYGDEDPLLDYSVTGLVGDDVLIGCLIRESGEDAGEYLISTENLDNVSNINYNIVFGSGTFKINKRVITVTANNRTKIYGDNDPILTYSVNNLKPGDDLTGTLIRENGQNAGEYAITTDSINNTNNPNYDITFVQGTFSIIKKDITISADYKSKYYGVINDPALTYTINGLVSDDTVSGSLIRETGNDIGSYDINVGTLSAGANYNVLFVKGVFSILPNVGCNIISVTAPEGSLIDGLNITVNIENSLSSLDLIIEISEYASYKVFTDEEMLNEVTGKLNLYVGENDFYIEVTAQDDEISKVYNLLITREASSEKDLVSSTDDILFAGNQINIEDYDSSTMDFSDFFSVSENADYKIYTDEACTQEISGEQLVLKTGSNQFYVKVTAQDGTVQNYVITVKRSAPIWLWFILSIILSSGVFAGLLFLKKMRVHK